MKRILSIVFLSFICTGIIWADTTTPSWQLLNETMLSNQETLDSYKPYYTFNQDQKPAYTRDTVMPTNALQLNSSLVNDCYIKLAGNVPHNIKWEVEVLAKTEEIILIPEADGIVFTTDERRVGLSITQSWQTVSMERIDNKITVRVGDTGKAITFVTEDAKVPLSLTVRHSPLVWLRQSKLYTTVAEPWSPATNKTTEVAAIDESEWNEVYRQTFDNAESMTNFVADNDIAVAKWLSDEQCLYMRAGGKEMSDITLRLKHSFPGDIRMSFRGRNIAPQDQFFGAFVSCTEILRKEDGYFCEWNRGWMRRIKKFDVQRKIIKPYLPTNKEERWVNYRIDRIGSKITMYTDGEETLSWVDPAPPTSTNNGYVGFYVWQSSIKFDNLVIEQRTKKPTNIIEAASIEPPATTTIEAPANLVRSTDVADTIIVHDSGNQLATALRAPMLNQVTSNNKEFSFSWLGDSEYEYDVEMCTSLTDNKWNPVNNSKGLRANNNNIKFTADVSQQGHCFYRVKTRRRPL